MDTSVTDELPSPPKIIRLNKIPKELDIKNDYSLKNYEYREAHIQRLIHKIIHSKSIYDALIKFNSLNIFLITEVINLLIILIINITLIVILLLNVFYSYIVDLM